MNVRDLSIKFASYAHFIASREWAREDAGLPRLLCVAPHIAQEKRIQRMTGARLEQTPGLVMYTTTEVLLNVHGLLAPIWLLHTPRCVQERVTGSVQRCGLFGKEPGHIDRTPSWCIVGSLLYYVVPLPAAVLDVLLHNRAWRSESVAQPAVTRSYRSSKPPVWETLAFTPKEEQTIPSLMQGEAVVGFSPLRENMMT